MNSGKMKISNRSLRWLFLFLPILFLGSCGKVASVEEEGSLAGSISRLTVTKTKIDPIKVGVPYSQTVTIEGGRPPYKYLATHGELPTGLTLNESSGEIAGTVPPAEAGKKASFTVLVSDSLGLTAEQQYSAEIQTYEFFVFPESMPEIAPGFAFEMGFSAQDALPPVKWTYSGKLPPGMELDNDKGILKSEEGGVSTDFQGTTWQFTVIATDVSKIQSTRNYKVKIAKTIPIPPVKIATTSLSDATAGALYSASIAVTGGVSPFKFELINGTLINGLTLEENTGLIAGSVPRTEIGKKASFGIKVTDAREQSHEYPFNLTVLPYTFALAPEELPSVTPNQTYSFKVSAIGAAEPVLFSLSGSLPAGLVLDASTGRITDINGGVPTGLQNTNQIFTIVAEDANKVRVSRQYTLGIGPASVIPQLQIVTTSMGASPASGTNFNRIIAVSGGVTPYIFSSPDLPAWMTISSSTGEISGNVPYYASTQAQVFNVFVIDSQSTQVSKTYALTINPYTLSVSPAGPALPNADPGASYQATLLPSGRETGFSGYSFALQSGTMPTGLGLSSSGVISGTVGEAEDGQTRNFTVNVTDGVLNKPTSYSIVVNNYPISVTASLASATENSVYSASISAAYTNPVTSCVSCTFEISGALPAGLTVSGAGMISGTPGAGTGDLAGRVYAFSVRARDAQGKISRSTAVSLTVNVSVASLAVDVTPPVATLNKTFSWRGIAASGGRSPYVYSITSGTLPAGLSINASTGEISGTPTAPVTCPGNDVGIRATDALGQQTSVATRCITVNAATVSTAALTNAIEGSSYSFPLAATGGTSPYTWEFFANPATLPGGLVFSSSGNITGTPAAMTGSVAGVPYTFDVRATDVNGVPSLKKTLTLTVTVSPPVVVVGTVPSGLIGSSFSYTLGATGGRPPYTFSLGGSLPAGLSLASGTGVISGLPSSAVTCPAGNFSIVAGDSLSQSSSSTPVCITITDGIKFVQNVLPTVTRSVFYSTTVSASGGASPYTYSAVNLPTGLGINSSTGEISGFTTVTPDTYVSYLTARDANNKETTRAYNVIVANALVVTAATLPSAGTARSYGPVTISATGGVSPYAFSLVSGQLPPGLSLSGNQISGTASSGGAVTKTYNFSIRVADSSGLVSNPQAFVIDVTVPPTIRSMSLRPAPHNQLYAMTLRRRGGVPPFTWTASNLPAGLTMETSTGIIQGTASAAGNYSGINVTVTDSKGLAHSRTYTMRVENNTKFLDLHAPRFSEPCVQTPGATPPNCGPRGTGVGPLATRVDLVNSSSPKFLVYSVTSPSALIYVSKLDSQGRVPTPGTGSLYNVSLTPNGVIYDIAVNDIDNDGFLDIIASDWTNGKINVFWNTGTPDVNGMPTYVASPSVFNLAGTDKYPISLKVVNLDPSKPLRKDIIVTSNWAWTNISADTPNNTSMRVNVLIGQCNTTNCTRAGIYVTPGSSLATTTPGPGTLQYATHIGVGKFRTADNCRDIVVTGRSTFTNNKGYYLVYKQDTSGSTCLNTYTTTPFAQEISTTSSYPAGVAIADFNADGIDDVAVVGGSLAKVDVFFMNGSTGVFPGGGTALPTASPSLPTVGAKIIPYCLDGALSCSNPSLLVYGNRPRTFLGTGSNVTTWGVVGGYNMGYISVIPNMPLLFPTTYFENNAGQQRIDYTVPVGVWDTPNALPLIGSNTTRNDLLIAGYDDQATSMPFIMAIANNDGNTENPLKLAMMMKSMPDDFFTTAEVGSLEAVVQDDSSLYPDLVTHVLTNSGLGYHSGAGDAMKVPMSPPNPEFITTVQHYTTTVNFYYRQNAIAVADVDNDGYQDVVTAGQLGRGIGVHFGNGSSYLTSPVILSPGTGDVRPNHLRIGDIDNDGIVDIVALTQTGGAATPTVMWLKGNGNGTFQDAAPAIANGIGNLNCTDARSLEIRDLDGDGKPEIAVLCYNTNSIFIFRRHTDGTWKAGNMQITGFTNPIAFSFAHLTPGDACATGTEYTGKPCIDIAVSQLLASNSVRIVRNLTLGAPAGGGTFNLSQTSFSANIPLNGYGGDIDTADIDGDGHVDVIMSMHTQNSMQAGTSSGMQLYVLHGNGTGNFPYIGGWGMEGRGGTGISVFDYDKNGRPDIFVTYRGALTPYRMISRWFNYTQ